MSKLSLLLYAFIMVVVGSIVYILFLHTPEKSLQTWKLTSNEQDESFKIQQQTNKSIVYLYFADKDNSYLTAKECTIFHSDDPVAFGRIILEALIKGPNNELMRTIPEGTTLNAFYVTSEGTAYVDLTEAVRENHPGGSYMEYMTIYSIVNSLVLNIPQIKLVKILIGGSESMTLAGHIDLRYPLKANMLLVR